MVLITTREALVAKAFGARQHDLDAMTDQQALALISGRLGRELDKQEQESASTLAKTVGYLPLALELAATQVADGVTWSLLIDDLTREIANLKHLKSLESPGVEYITDESTHKRMSLDGSFNLSLRRLPHDTYIPFAWLGVLPEDVSITPHMAANLWSVDISTARTTLRLLRDKALLMPGVPLSDGTNTYRLHDLVHVLAKRVLTTAPDTDKLRDLPGIGLTMIDAHRTLLKRYQVRTQNGLWHTVNDDTYIANHLTWHMEHSGNNEMLHSLLKEETAAFRNGWYHAREELGQIAGYMSDVGRAWRLTETAHEDVAFPIAVGLQCRYALITASINSLASNLLPRFLAALVEKRVWPITQGLAYARHVPDQLHRAKRSLS